MRRTLPESSLRELEPLSRDCTGALRGAGVLAGCAARAGADGGIAERVGAACTGADRTGARFTGIGLLRTVGAGVPEE